MASTPPIVADRLQLFYTPTCVFCIKVRIVSWWMGLDLPLKNTLLHPGYKSELIAGGGKYQVPCLRIETAQDEIQWLYESDQIIRYLKQDFTDN